jgi:hypothetical protein
VITIATLGGAFLYITFPIKITAKRTNATIKTIDKIGISVAIIELVINPFISLIFFTYLIINVQINY